MIFEYPIDENKLLILRLEVTQTGNAIARLHSRYSPDSKLVDAILPAMSVARVKADQNQRFLLSTIGDDEPFPLQINGIDFAYFVKIRETFTLKRVERTLSVFETRMIGRAPLSDFPKWSSMPQEAGISDMLTPLTDLHTHLSGQVKAKDLIAMGSDAEHEILYPTAALDMLQLEYDPSRVQKIPKRVFLPLAHLQASGESEENAVPMSSLGARALAILENAMSLSPENQNTFEDLEKCYYLREPFNKDLRLLPSMLKVIAEDYQRQGIRYAVLSSNAILSADWLETVHRVMPSLEARTGVALRFKAGLPRNLDEAALAGRIEQYKRIAGSPYILGLDFLGYEIDKTSRRLKVLDSVAQWMQQNQPDDILQIHAGENAKNPKNVLEALQIAERHGIRLDIGHALYGLDHETLELAMKLAARLQLICQCNPDSNLALNNIDFPWDVPILRLMELGIPCIVGSDGAAIYLTDARQTAMATELCGMTPAGFQALRKTEEDFIARQKSIFERKQAAFPADFFATLDPVPPPAAKVEKKPAIEAVPIEIPAVKRPIFLAGAGGKNWDDLSEPLKSEFSQGLEKMLEILRPEDVYFVKGRTKDSGVNIELEKAISNYNRTHATGFDCITMLAESEPAKSDYSPHFKTLKLPLALANLPSYLIGFLKERRGFALYAGGKNFTRDFILKSATADLPFALMEDIKGASQDKAAIYSEHAIQGIEGMTACAHRIRALRRKSNAVATGELTR